MTWVATFFFLLICVDASPSQENVKTKHPQLLYESKLYKILQGGSNGLYHFPFFFFNTMYVQVLIFLNSLPTCMPCQLEF